MSPQLHEDEETLKLWTSLLSSVRRRGVDPHTAEDIVQETWLRKLRCPPEECGHTKGWLHVVALRLIGEFRRRSRLEAPLGGQDRGRSDPTPVAADESRLLRWVDELPSPYREVIRLRYVEEREIHEIAATLGRSQATIRSQIKRGLDQLRFRLGPAPRSRLRALLTLVLAGRKQRAGDPVQPWAGSRRLWIGCAAALLAVCTWLLEQERVASRPKTSAPEEQHLAREALGLEAPLLAGSLSIEGRRALSAPEPAADARVHVFGRVVAPDGTPVGGASVFVGLRDERQLVAKTDENGRYSAERIDPQRCIWATSDLWWDSNHCYVASADEVDELNLHLNEIEGREELRVFSHAGRALADARIVLQAELDVRAPSYVTERGTLEEPPLKRESVTDESGRAWLAWPRCSRASIFVSAPGEACWVGPLDAGNDTRIGEIHMPAPAVVEGRIHDAAGRPARNAGLEILQYRARVRLAGTCGNDGSFQIRGLAPGPFVLRATEDPTRGIDSARWEGTVTAGETLTIEMELSARATLRGRALFAGRPIPGTQVKLTCRSSASEEVKRSTSVGSDGSFSFAGCPDEARGSFMLIPPGEEQPCLIQDLASSGAKILDSDVDLEARSPLEIVLSGAEGLRPVSLLLVTRLPSGFNRVLRGAEGGRRFRSGPVPAGTYDVTAWIPGWGRWHIGELQHDPSSCFVHPLSLPPPSTIRVRLALPSAADPDDFEVYAETQAFNKALLGFQSDELLRRLPFDPGQGVFSGKLHWGKYPVKVRRSGFADLDALVVLDVGETVDLSLTPEPGVTVELDLEFPRQLIPVESLTLDVRSTEGWTSRRIRGMGCRSRIRVSLCLPSSALDLRVATDQGLHASLALAPGWAANADQANRHLALVLAAPEQTGASDPDVLEHPSKQSSE